MKRKLILILFEVESVEEKEHCLKVVGSISCTEVKVIDDDPFGVPTKKTFDLAATLTKEGLAFTDETLEKISKIQKSLITNNDIVPKTWKDLVLPTARNFKVQYYN